MEVGKSLTQKILEHYRTIGHREVLSQWRKEVPSDVRKIWIKNFVREVAYGKLFFDHERFRDIFVKALPDAQRQEYEEIVRAGGADVEARLGSFLKRDISERTLEEFTQAYFLSFDSNEEKVGRFFREQQESVNALAPVLNVLFAKGREVMRPLHRMFPFNDLYARSYNLMLLSPNMVNLEPYAGSLVVSGSGAIGPREEGNTLYPGGTQDIDLFFLPHQASARMLEEVNFLCGSVDLIGALLHEYRRIGDDYRVVLLENVESRFPELAALINALGSRNQFLDLHSAWMRVDGFLDSWQTLCGPHRVAQIFSPHWEESYRFFLNQAIASARKTQEKNF